MTLAFSRPAVRPFATLLAALVFASSAAVVVAADTHAAKPVPFVLGTGADCQEVLGTTTYEAWFDLGGNKGKWVRVDVDYKLGGDWTPYATASRVETVTLNAAIERVEPWQVSFWKLTFVDRNGAQVANSVPTVVTASTCSVTP